MYSSVALSTFTLLCDHLQTIIHPSPELFLSFSQTDLLFPLNSYFPLSPSPASGNYSLSFTIQKTIGLILEDEFKSLILGE